MVIFHSYVSLPEGTLYWATYQKQMQLSWSDASPGKPTCHGDKVSVVHRLVAVQRLFIFLAMQQVEKIQPTVHKRVWVWATQPMHTNAAYTYTCARTYTHLHIHIQLQIHTHTPQMCALVETVRITICVCVCACVCVCVCVCVHSYKYSAL